MDNIINKTKCLISKKNLNLKKSIKKNNQTYLSFNLTNLFKLKSYLNNKIPQSEIINLNGYTYINKNYLKLNEIELSN